MNENDGKKKPETFAGSQAELRGALHDLGDSIYAAFPRKVQRVLTEWGRWLKHI